MSVDKKEESNTIPNQPDNTSLSIEDVCRVKNFQIGELPKNSLYVRPFQLTFNDERNNKTITRRWDTIEAHGSVVLVVYNRTTDSLVFVRQFRPAVHVSLSAEAQQVSSIDKIDFTRQDPTHAVTYELCAGLIDKRDVSNKEHARIELLEECGYAVDLDSIESVSKYRSGVGIVGSMQELFYVEVTNDMKINAGGGNPAENELIVVEEIRVDDLYKFLFDESKPKETGLMFGVMWFLHKKGRLP